MCSSHEQNDPILDHCSVVDAIGGLATYDGTNDEHVRDWLRTLMVNFIESVRFDAIAGRAACQMKMSSSLRGTSEAGADRRLTPGDIELISRWGNISRDSVQAVDDWSSWISWGVNSLANAGTVLGMALVSGAGRTNKRPHRAVAVDGDNSGVVGVTLAEVVGVVIRNINDYETGKLYGTITLTDGFGAVQLYNRGKGDHQKVSPGGKADLDYPPRAVSGADDFVIDVDLMDHYIGPISDRKVAVGQVAWNSRDALSRDYNRVLKVPVKARHGEVEVQYAVMSDAVVAAVEVVIVDSGNNIFSPDVYGSVTATASMASSGSGEQQLQYTLFDKAPKQRCSATRKKDIRMQLQRKLVSVPLCSKLRVSASLWDFNRYKSPDHIVDGSVDFTPGLYGEKEITGPRGTVKVIVTWSASFSHQ